MSNILFYNMRSYLDCWKEQLLKLLILEGIPVEYFFYNAFEDTRDIYHEIIVKKKEAWMYPTNYLTVNDLESIGIREVRNYFNCFEEAKEFVVSKLENKQKLLMWSKTKYLTHMKLPLSEGCHVLGLYNVNNDRTSFQYSELSGDQYSIEVLRNAFDSLPYHQRYITYLDYSAYNLSEDIIAQAINLNNIRIQQFEDDLTFYDKVIKLIHEDMVDNKIKTMDNLNLIVNALTALSGSRLLYLIFARKVGFTEDVLQLLLMSSNKADQIKNMIRKNILSNKLSKMDFEKVTSSCLELQKLDKKIINALLHGIENRSSKVFNYKQNDLLEYNNALKFDISELDEKEKKTDFALHKKVYSSSVSESNYKCAHVVDDNLFSRWSSEESDSQWIYVDLESEHSIQSIELHWEFAHAKHYVIQISIDSQHWSDIYNTTIGEGGSENIKVAAYGRYIRLNLLKRGTPFGYSLWRFSVY